MLAWIKEDNVARPLSARSRSALWLVDAQVLTERAIDAVRGNRREEAIRAMRMAREYYKLAAGRVDGVPRPKAQ